MGGAIVACFFQAEDGIRGGHVTGVQTVCSSDLLKRSARSCEEIVITPSSSSWRRQRVYTERRRIVISGIFGKRSCERSIVICGTPGSRARRPHHVLPAAPI